MFEKAPGFMAIIDGPACIITLANPAFHRLFDGRTLLQKPARSVLSDLEGQIFLRQMDEVHRSARPYPIHAMPLRCQVA